MKKKGVELSMNVIIIAAIGLLVLVILAVLVINATSKVPAAQRSCNLQAGVCKASCNTAIGEQPIDADCGAAGGECCKIFSTE